MCSNVRIKIFAIEMQQWFPFVVLSHVFRLQQSTLLKELQRKVYNDFSFVFLSYERTCQHYDKYASLQVNLTFTGRCIATIFTEYNQQDATFHNLIISVRRCTCFRWGFRPSSGAQNCTYSVRYLSPILLPAASLTSQEIRNKNRFIHFWKVYNY